MSEATRHYTREEIRRRLGDPTLALVDVLPRTSWEESHIPGSLSLPVDEIPARATELLADRAQEIATYCGGPT